MSVSTLAKRLVTSSHKNGLLFTSLENCSTIQFQRSLTTKKLTPTLSYITNGDASTIESHKGKFKIRGEGKPLSILLCWLMAKNNAVNKYAKFYLDNGFDVLTVRISPTQLLLPTKANQIVETELMPILRNCDHEKSLIHGFSVGGYVFGQMLRVANEQPHQYKETMQKMGAQIWDSVVDVQGTAIGVSKSVFPKSPLPQKLLKDYIDFHMKMMHNISTKHYYISHEYFYDKPLNAPALFLNSEKDPISTVDVIEAVGNTWTSKGMKVSKKLWPNTPHVGHMQRHPEEYKKTVTDFLFNNGVRPSKGRVVNTQKENVFTPDYNVVG